MSWTLGLPGTVKEGMDRRRARERVAFSPESFAEGRFRRAYKGRYTSPRSKRGKEVVVKELKDQCTWDAADWDTTVKIHKKASELASGFNAFSGTTHPVRFTKIAIHCVVTRSDPNSSPRLGESVTVEEYIRGDFKKWCNNYGFISNESLSMPAFMHWSWVHTGGEVMVSDLQGTRWTKYNGERGGYILTDPAIISLSNSYGQTDTGAEGMLMFFYNHKCNRFCEFLPKPTTSDFISRVPRRQLRACMGKLSQLQAATTYTADLKLSPFTREIVADVLKGVASQY